MHRYAFLPLSFSLSLYIYITLTIIIRGDVAINWRVDGGRGASWRDGNLEGLKGRKVRGKVMKSI